MSIAGFKKQVNKANQFVVEKIAGAKATELDDVFIDMEKKTESFEKLMHELSNKVTELLQPNPASRVKMAASKGISKIKGQSGNAAYPQPEGNLAEVMLRFGPEFGAQSAYGRALVEAGECFREMSDEKYKLEDVVKQNFIEPIQQIENKELREVNHHRKKLVGRRLDYDCKKRKHSKEGSNISQDELNTARDKFEESKHLAEAAMSNLLDNDSEQISQLLSFVEAQLNYHKRCSFLLENLEQSLKEKQSLASSAPRREPRIHPSGGSGNNRVSREGGSFSASDFITPRNVSPQLINFNSESSEVKAEALFDFEAENNNELDFKTGSIIRNVKRIDENWLEGTFMGKTGYFPTAYVKIISGYL